MRANRLLLAAAAAALLAGCSQHKGWQVSGTIEGADADTQLAIEGFNAGNWYNIDSVAVKADGTFIYQSPTGSPYPDVYRVSLDGKSIYFPIDSLDKITIKADADHFDADFTIDGTPTAVAMMNIDKRIAEVAAQKGPEAAVADSLLKRELNQAILDDSVGVLSYYIINKTLGGRPIYAADNRRDVAMLGAIAQKFMDKMPNDPRTKYLAATFLRARKQTNPGNPVEFEARATGLVDIRLYDDKGAERSLSDVANGAGVTLLSFTTYDMESSLAYNVELNRLYELYAPQGIRIYQVAFDPDEVEWRQSASNLPWVTVRNNPLDGDKLLSIYNVGVLPTTFIIDRNGDIVDRVVDPSALQAAIAKVL